MIVIIDYGMGNLHSMQNMLKRVGVPSLISDGPEDIAKATKLILPGVGAFDEAMRNIEVRNLRTALDDRVLGDRIPVLGVCLGMQLMTGSSEEGSLPGLGWLDAETVRFDLGENPQGLKVPHMGWNVISPAKQHGLFDNLGHEPRFYFVHSYHVVCRDQGDALATTHHGYDFISVFQHENVLGVQFHPEKSHRFGMEVLRHFAGSC